MSGKIVKRKSGNLVALNIEIDASQYRRLEEISNQLGMTKRDIVSSALNCWISLSGVERRS